MKFSNEFSSHFHMDEFVTADREFSFDLATGVSNLERNILEVYLVVTDDVGNTGNKKKKKLEKILTKKFYRTRYD